MDPNAALGEIRAAIANAFAKDEEIDTGEAVAAMEYFRDLDEWLCKGGFLPRVWQPKS